MNIKETVKANKGKIIAAIAVAGTISAVILTKRVPKKAVKEFPGAVVKDLPVPAGLIGNWEAFWHEVGHEGLWMNALVEGVPIDKMGEFGESLLKAGYKEKVNLIVGEPTK